MGTITVSDSITANVSSYDSTNHSYASISSQYPISNAYTASNSTTYCQVNLTTGSNAETYVYLKFDFSAIPSNATIKSVTAKAKGYISTTTVSRVGTRQMQLAAGTTLKGSALTMSNTASEQTFSSVGDWTRAEIVTAGVRYYAKRGTSNTSNNYYIRMYGATMTVTYEYEETTYTITVSNSTSAIVTSSDSEVAAGSEVCINASTLSGITIKDNGTDITSQFIAGSSDTVEAYPDSYQTGGSINGTRYQSTIGHSVSNPSSQTGSDYFSTTQGGSGSTWIDYYFDFSSIPAGATISSMTVQVRGHAEDTSQSREIAKVQLYSGTTAKGNSIDFTSTSDATYTISNYGSWTASELANAKIRFTIGVYGGLMTGATWTVSYEISGYVYTITNVVENHTIVVTSSGGTTDTIYVKVNGSWVAATKVYKKVNGSWVEQSDLANVFTEGVNYVKR